MLMKIESFSVVRSFISELSDDSASEFMRLLDSNKFIKERAGRKSIT